MREQFKEAAMIAAMQALIQNNPGISCKFAAKKAQEYAEQRSEERRVGKECAQLCRSRWSPYH